MSFPWSGAPHSHTLSKPAKYSQQHKIYEDTKCYNFWTILTRNLQQTSPCLWPSHIPPMIKLLPAFTDSAVSPGTTLLVIDVPVLPPNLWVTWPLEKNLPVRIATSLAWASSTAGSTTVNFVRTLYEEDKIYIIIYLLITWEKTYQERDLVQGSCTGWQVYMVLQLL